MIKPPYPFFALLLLTAYPVLPLAAEEAIPAPTAEAAKPAMTYATLKKQVTELKAKNDFAGLEALIKEVRTHRETLYGEFSPISTFYNAVVVDKKDDEKRWAANKEFLDAWQAAFPESAAVKTALIKYWCGYAWKARGSGWASTVTKDGWAKMGARLAEARKIYDAAEAKGGVDDVYFYWKSLTIALGQGWSFDEVINCMLKGRKIEPNYLGLYTSTAYYLAPKWHGEPGDVEKFAALASGLFQGEDADYIYARTINYAIDSRRDDAKDFFDRNPGAYERIKRGCEAGMKHCENRRTRARAASQLARFATIKGDYETAKKLFLGYGGEIDSDVFGSEEIQLEMMKKCGAQAELDRAAGLEREGKLAEAEALYKTLEADAPQDQTVWYRRLHCFYLRQGMKESLMAMGAKPIADMQKAAMNDVAYEVYRAMMLGDWDAVKTGAERFDAARPWNLIGRGALFFDAARRGDKAAGEALKASFLENKTKRPALQNAQAVLRGEKTWQELAPKFRELDGYSSQAAVLLIGYQLSQGNRQVAAEMRDAFTPPGGLGLGVIHIDILHAMQYGSLKGFFEEPKP